jgi:ribosomal protein L11 methylase PrmA
MHAVALELLSTHLEKGKKCLDIGSGSGYLTLAFYKLMEKDEEVFSYGIEHIP